MAPTPASEPKPGSFEAHLRDLERVVADLEGDALSLESSISRYQDGVRHLAECRKILDAAEQRLAELVATPDGGVAERPLAVGPEGLVDAGPVVRPAGPPTGGAGDPVRPKRAAPRRSTPADDDIPF